jgi:ribosome-associated protein
MLKINDAITLGEGEVAERFVRAMGADGQNANRDATAVELRLDVAASSLPSDVKHRLIVLGGRRVTRDGVLVVVSRQFRSQSRNREAARKSLANLVAQAAAAPRPRVK